MRIIPTKTELGRYFIDAWRVAVFNDELTDKIIHNMLLGCQFLHRLLHLLPFRQT